MLTETQKKILAFITERIQDHGLPPTLREIGARFKITSTGSVSYHLNALEKEGALKRPALVHRVMDVIQNPFQLPILGRVGAGGGMIAQEDVQGYVSFKNFALGADYLLSVKGNSMEGEGIFEGDLVQVRRQPTANDGDIVVALVGEEGVVKRLRKRGRSFLLESANPKYAPITADFQVIGKVLGLVRRYAQ